MKYKFKPGDHLILNIEIEMDISKKIEFTDEEIKECIKHYLRRKQETNNFLI